jgi:hypothetical protein
MNRAAAGFSDHRGSSKKSDLALRILAAAMKRRHPSRCLGGSQGRIGQNPFVAIEGGDSRAHQAVLASHNAVGSPPA